MVHHGSQPSAPLVYSTNPIVPGSMSYADGLRGGGIGTVLTTSEITVVASGGERRYLR